MSHCQGHKSLTSVQPQPGVFIDPFDALPSNTDHTTTCKPCSLLITILLLYLTLMLPPPLSFYYTLSHCLPPPFKCTLKVTESERKMEYPVRQREEREVTKRKNKVSIYLSPSMAYLGKTPSYNSGEAQRYVSHLITKEPKCL